MPRTTRSSRVNRPSAPNRTHHPRKRIVGEQSLVSSIISDDGCTMVEINLTDNDDDRRTIISSLTDLPFTTSNATTSNHKKIRRKASRKSSPFFVAFAFVLVIAMGAILRQDVKQHRHQRQQQQHKQQLQLRHQLQPEQEQQLEQDEEQLMQQQPQDLIDQQEKKSHGLIEQQQVHIEPQRQNQQPQERFEEQQEKIEQQQQEQQTKEQIEQPQEQNDQRLDDQEQPDQQLHPTVAKTSNFFVPPMGLPEDKDFVLPFDLGQHMREWLAKKQLENTFFYTPPESERKVTPYSTKEIAATLPHFTRELLLVMYDSGSDDFVVLLPGLAGGPPPKCDAGCAKIGIIMQAIVSAFRNRHSHRFQGREGESSSTDLLFLVSTADTPRLTRECLARPGDCQRRKAFAPILHFGSGFSDQTILPTLITMPPPLRMHLRCMAEWQARHEVCEYLLPKTIAADGRETQGVVFGKVTEEGEEGIVWEDLINQVVWRGQDYSYMPLLYPELKSLDFVTDVDPKLGKYGRGVGGVLHALNDVYDELRPRWKAAVITAHSEFKANVMNVNPKRNTKVIPWANMKFLPGALDTNMKLCREHGVPVREDELSLDELAKYKYHIDIGGGGGTSVSGTIQKLAFPGVLFHPETSGYDWYHEHLQPWVHYVPVKEDLSDLKEKYEWAERHDRKARAIAKMSTEFVRRMGRPEGLEELYRRHFLNPLEDVMEAYQSNGGLTDLGGDILLFKEIMRCSGYNIHDCVL